MTSESLTNKFLIAMPQLQDSCFEGSVIYVCNHNDEGALGLIINKPSELPLFEIFAQLELEDERANQTVLSGGPVENDKGFILHRSERSWTSTINLTNDLKLTTSKDILSSIARNDGPEEYLMTLGCSGWNPGQLEQELADNSWLAIPANQDILFSDDFANMADMIASTLGFNMVQLTPEIGYC